jgi:1-aminocyclopropane-1-carboxylate deaminase
MLLNLKESPNQEVTYHPKEFEPLKLWIKRDDLLHEHISGNKYRKLKYNVEFAYQNGYNTLLTFGGAFSNHIAATAAAGNELGFKTIGIIRGDELSEKEDLIRENPTLQFAKECGMQFKFVSRSDYRLKDTKDFIEKLKNEFGKFYLVPQGGTNALAVKGCEEILTEDDSEFDYVCSAMGTGGTISGIINTAFSHQKVLGFPALKDDFLEKEINNYIHNFENWELIKAYHFGGFAKINNDLVQFINDFKKQTSIALDPIYTGKMFFGIVDLYKKGYFDKSKRILAIHTGGLQGIKGMNIRLINKELSVLE